MCDVLGLMNRLTFFLGEKGEIEEFNLLLDEGKRKIKATKAKEKVIAHVLRMQHVESNAM